MGHGDIELMNTFSAIAIYHTTSGTAQTGCALDHTLKVK